MEHQKECDLANQQIARLKEDNATLKKKVETLQTEVLYLRSIESGKEKYVIILVRFVAFFIGFAPFVPNMLFFLGFNDEKVAIGTSEVFFVAIGFVMLWGSKNFGEWATGIGKKIQDKY